FPEAADPARACRTPAVRRDRVLSRAPPPERAHRDLGHSAEDAAALFPAPRVDRRQGVVGHGLAVARCRVDAKECRGFSFPRPRGRGRAQSAVGQRGKTLRYTLTPTLRSASNEPTSDQPKSPRIVATLADFSISA